MAKARMKPKHQNYEETYWDSSGIVHENKSLYEILENISAVYKFGGLPKHVKLSEIDKTVFGIYTILNDPDGPYNNGDNSWYTVVNLPGQQGTNYSIQLAFSYWELCAWNFGVWIRHGRGDTWRQINLQPTQTPILVGTYPLLHLPYSNTATGQYQIGNVYSFKDSMLEAYPLKAGFRRTYKVMIDATSSDNIVYLYLGGHQIADYSVWGANSPHHARTFVKDITDIVNEIPNGHCSLDVKNINNRGNTWFYINSITLLVYDTYAG